MGMSCLMYGSVVRIALPPLLPDESIFTCSVEGVRLPDSMTDLISQMCAYFDGCFLLKT